jgi:hypothetical protein
MRHAEFGLLMFIAITVIFFSMSCTSGYPPSFNTGLGTYPSVPGTFNGTIRASETITVDALYTYPCAGTGGHTEYAAISYQNGTVLAETQWNGYTGDWQNLFFDNNFTLLACETYNYTIITRSYPQIIHAGSKDVIGGIITCSEFIDVNGNQHEDWIPAIRLFSTSTPTPAAHLTIADVTPSEFNPGETSEVLVTVGNTGSWDARDIQLAFQGTDFLSIIGAAVVHINTLDSWNSKDIQITVHVADEAPNDVYCMPVYCSWRDYYFDPLQGYVTGPEQNVVLGLSFRVR